MIDFKGDIIYHKLSIIFLIVVVLPYIQGCSKVVYKVNKRQNIKKLYQVSKDDKERSYRKKVETYENDIRKTTDKYLKVQIKKGDNHVKEKMYAQAQKDYLTSYFISSSAGDVVLRKLRLIPNEEFSNKNIAGLSNLKYKTLELADYLKIKPPKELFKELIKYGKELQEQGEIDRAQSKYLTALQLASSDKSKKRVIELINKIDLLKLKNKAILKRDEAIDDYYASNYEEAIEKIKAALKLDPDNDGIKNWHDKIMAKSLQ